MIVHSFVQKDALAASVHSYLRQRQAQQYIYRHIGSTLDIDKVSR